MRAKLADRLSRLDEQSFVILEGSERTDDRIESLPATAGPAGAAINHELVGIFCDLRIEIVHEHAERCLLLPALAADLTPAWSPDDAFSTHCSSNPLSKSPARIAAAVRAMSFERGRSSVNGFAISRTALKARSTPTPARKGRRYSNPSAALRISMAIRFSAASTIARSFKAEVIPIET